MRLLSASTFAVIEKHENELPPYAILSHTWGDNEDEVTLQEIQQFSRSRHQEYIITSQLSTTNGFSKIQQAGRLAVPQGMEFMWIDTCCIDQTSSVELSKAICANVRAWCRLIAYAHSLRPFHWAVLYSHKDMVISFSN
jgi:hypothetical protein